MQRYLYPYLLNDLHKKMVWISGPRQCGKTTLAKSLLQTQTSGVYLNWDDPDHRKAILRRNWSEDASIVALGEIHKFPRWKSWLKGTYDTSRERHRFVITGSARLDVYRRGGDSMLGRYHAWRLHPFCLAEYPEGLSKREALRRLLQFGGFPEPFVSADEIESKRWRRERRERVIREDIRDLERIRDTSLLSVLIDLLAERVGGPVTYSNLAEDLQVAPKTVKNWVELLERMYLVYLVFLVRPYSRSLARAIVKPPKVYFYDNADVSPDNGARFENLVASHLLKRLNFLEDSTGDRYELRYVRDKEGHEADFLILHERRPVCLIEAKHADEEPARSLAYFGDKLGVRKRIQVVKDLKAPVVRSGISIVPAAEWLSQPLDAPLFTTAGS